MNNEPTASANRVAVDLALLVVRVVAGVIFAAHGAQKLFGVWGGPGLAKTVEMLGVGPLGYLVGICEFFGGLGLILGFLTRFSAVSLIVIMIGAIYKVHGQHGFFLQNQGFEYNLALIGLLLPTLLCGPGRFSIGPFLPLPKSAKTGCPVMLLE
jgi:putative oxidoreductase